MALSVTTCMPDKFREDLFGGFHVWKAAGGNTFRLGLFVSAASGNRTYDKDTENYSEIIASPDDENAAVGYTAKGETLTLADASQGSNVAFVDFTNDITWSSITMTARAAFILNDTHASDRIVSLHDFGSDKTADGGDFVVQAPAAASGTAILRLA